MKWLSLFALLTCLPPALCGGELPDLNAFTDLTKVTGGKVIQESFDRGSEGWNLPDGFAIAPRMGLNGTDALSYTRSNPDDYPILSRDIELDKDTTYTFRFWFRTEGMSVYTGKTEIRWVAGIEYYEKDKWIAGISSDANGAHLLNQPWKEVVLKTRPPRNCDRVRLIFYLESNYVGKIFYDNVVIEPESKIGAEIYDTRPGNLRLNGKGHIELRAALFGSERQNPDDLAMLVDAGGRKQLLRGQDGCYAGDFGEFPDGEVTIKASLLNLRNKTIITAKVFRLHAGEKTRVAGASEIDDAGFTRVDGKRFLPVGFFGGNLTDADMKRLQSAQVNCYMPYTSMFMGKNGTYVESFKEVARTMDRFRQHGIKVLFALNGQNPSQGNFVRKEYDGIKGVREISEAFIRRLAAHPAMLGYYLSDENPVHELPYIRSIRETAAKLDPDHFSVTLTFVPDDFPFYASTGDVLAVDNYPIDDNRYPTITPIYDVMKTANALKIPVWFVPQAFSWGGFKNLKPDQKEEFARYPFPTEQQLRAMTLAGAIAGAKGFLFYNYHSIFKTGEEFQPGSAEENWKRVTPVVSMLRELEPFLLSEETTPKIQVRSIAPQKIGAAVWKNGDEIRVAVTGNGPGKAAATITVPGYPNLRSRYGLTENLGGGKYRFKCSDIDSDLLY